MPREDLRGAFVLAAAEALQSTALTKCSRWAAKRRIMGNPFRGPYTTKYHPWAKEVHDSTASFNYSQKGAQLGMSEVAINRALYTIDSLKRDVLYVLPTTRNAIDFSKARFAPALSMSPYLRSIFTDTNSIGLKQAGSNTMYIRGSRGDSNLKSIPVSTLILDEVDEFDQKAIGLALTRLDGQLFKSVFGLSTPTIADYGINKLYKDTTQEHFAFKCPHCGRNTELIWPDCFELCGESVNDPDRHKSYIKCKECKHKLDQELKPEFLSKGFWQVMNPNSDTDHRGFYINQLYSFTVSPGELATYYLAGLSDEIAMQEFFNSRLGLPFIGEGAKITDEHFEACRREHTTNDARPRSVNDGVYTLGVDQGLWNYYTVYRWDLPGWCKGVNHVATPTLVDRGKFYENDREAELSRLMREWQIRACVIDADPNTLDASKFALAYPQYVFLCRFRSGQTGKEIAVSEYAQDVPMLTVDRSSWLSQTLGRFRTNQINLPTDIGYEYRDHVKAIIRTYVKDRSGNYTTKYVSTKADHYALSACYAELALPCIGARETNSDISEFL